MRKSALNNNHLQYESMGDKDKNLSIKEHIDVIRLSLSDIINNHKAQGKWEIHSGNRKRRRKFKENRKFI